MGSREAQLGALATASYEPTPNHRITAVALVTQTGEDRTNVVAGFSEAEGTEIENTQLRFIERQRIFNQLTGEHADIGDVLTLSWQLNASRTLRDQPGTSDLLYALGPSGMDSGLTLGASASNLLFQPVLVTQGGSDFSRAERGASFGLSASWSPR